MKLKKTQIQNRAKIIFAALFLMFYGRKVKKGQKKSAKCVFFWICVHFFLLFEKKSWLNEKIGGANSNTRLKRASKRGSFSQINIGQLSSPSAIPIINYAHITRKKLRKPAFLQFLRGPQKLLAGLQKIGFFGVLKFHLRKIKKE